MKRIQLNNWQKILLIISFLFIFCIIFFSFAINNKKDFSDISSDNKAVVRKVNSLNDLSFTDFDLLPKPSNDKIRNLYSVLFSNLGATTAQIKNIEDFIEDSIKLQSQWNTNENPITSFFDTILNDGSNSKEISIKANFDVDNPQKIISDFQILRYISPVVSKLTIEVKNIDLESYSKNPVSNSRNWEWISYLTNVKEFKISINNQGDNDREYLDLSKINFISSSILSFNIFDISGTNKIYLEDSIESTSFYKNLDSNGEIKFSNNVSFNISPSSSSSNNYIYYQEDVSTQENRKIIKNIGRPFRDPVVEDFANSTYINNVLIKPILTRNQVSVGMSENTASNSLNIALWDLSYLSQSIETIDKLKNYVDEVLSKIDQKSVVNDSNSQSVYYYTSDYTGDKEGVISKISNRDDFNENPNSRDSFFDYKQDYFLKRFSKTTPYFNLFTSYINFDYSDYFDNYEEIIDNIINNSNNYVFIDNKKYYYKKMQDGRLFLYIEPSEKDLLESVYSISSPNKIIYHTKKIDNSSRVSNFYFTSWEKLKQSFSNSNISEYALNYISSVNYNDYILEESPNNDNYSFLKTNLKWLSSLDSSYNIENVISLIKNNFENSKVAIFYDQDIQIFKPSFFNLYDYYDLKNKKPEDKANFIYYYNENIKNSNSLWSNLNYKIKIKSYNTPKNEKYENIDLYFYSYDDIKIFLKKYKEKVEFEISKNLPIDSYVNLESDKEYDLNKLIPPSDYQIDFDNPGYLSEILTNPKSNVYNIKLKENGGNFENNQEIECPSFVTVNKKCYYSKISDSDILLPSLSYQVGFKNFKDDNYYFSNIVSPYLDFFDTSKKLSETFIEDISKVKIPLNKDDYLSNLLISGYVYWKRSDNSNTLSDINYLVINIDDEKKLNPHYYTTEEYIKSLESLGTNEEKVKMVSNTLRINNLSSPSNVIPELETFLNPSFESLKDASYDQRISIDDKIMEPIIVNDNNEYKIYWSIDSADNIPKYSSFNNLTKLYYSSSDTLSNSQPDLKKWFEKLSTKEVWTTNDFLKVKNIDSKYLSFIRTIDDSSIYINSSVIPNLNDLINPKINNFNEWINHMKNSYLDKININNTSVFCNGIFYENKYNWICPSFLNPQFKPKFIELKNSDNSNSITYSVIEKISQSSKTSLKDVFSINYDASSISKITINPEKFQEIINSSKLIIKDPTEEQFNNEEFITIRYVSFDTDNPEFKEIEVKPLKVTTKDGPTYFWEKDGYEYLTKVKYSYKDSSGKIIYYPDIVSLYNSEDSSLVSELLEKEFPGKSFEKISKIYSFEATLKSLAVESSEETRNITNLAIVISIALLGLGLVLPIMAVVIKIYNRKTRLK